MDDIENGIDELGVLLMGHQKGIYWYGSVLSIQQARALAPFNNATSLQVVAGILAGIIWAIENPDAGIVEPDEMPFDRILEIANPYLGSIVGEYSDWSPLQHRGVLFDEEVDETDTWQFKNFRVF
jgi:homospermidine synthase